jgi:hypothetical protein
MSAATAAASAPSARIVKLDSAQPLTKPSKTKTKKSANKAPTGPKKRKADQPSSSDEEEGNEDDEDDDEDEEDVVSARTSLLQGGPELNAESPIAQRPDTHRIL